MSETLGVTLSQTCATLLYATFHMTSKSKVVLQNSRYNLFEDIDTRKEVYETEASIKNELTHNFMFLALDFLTYSLVGGLKNNFVFGRHMHFLLEI